MTHSTKWGLSTMSESSRKPTNLSIDNALLKEAKALKINLSRAAENGVRAAVLEAKAHQWKLDNAAAVESSNAFVEKHGLPLEKLRPF